MANLNCGFFYPQFNGFELNVEFFGIFDEGCPVKAVPSPKFKERTEAAQVYSKIEFVESLLDHEPCMEFRAALHRYAAELIELADKEPAR